MILLLVTVAIVIVAWWLLRSPLLSVRSVVTEGAVRSDPVAIAAGVGVVPGLPTISVDESAVVTALASDPWIASASVAVQWPGTVVIDVTERVPLAVASDGAATAPVAEDGVVLEAADPAPEATIEVDATLPEPGVAIADPAVLSALSFIAELPAPLRKGTIVTVDGPMLSAVVAGHPVRLGRGADVEQKARTLTALLDTELESGVSIDLVAPLQPAVSHPQPEVEGETDGPSEGEASG